MLFTTNETLLHETSPIKQIYFLSTVDMEGLALYYQGSSSYSAEYATMHFQLLMG